MSLKKKIFGSLFILACIAIVAGGFLWWQSTRTVDVIEKLSQELPEVDLSLSPLESLDLPEIDLQIPFALGDMDLGLETPEFYSRESINVDVPGARASAPTLNPSDIQDMIQGVLK